MNDRELIALMAAIVAAGCRADGGPINFQEAVETAIGILNCVDANNP